MTPWINVRGALQTVFMARQQLRLIETTQLHRIDEHTKAIGRKGLARARAELAKADQRRVERNGPDRPGRSSAA